MTPPIANRISLHVLHGIPVNGRLFQFLAYSSSQLRESSLWMVNLDGTSWTVSRMRESLGDFSQCPNPPKYAARMGQCFTTTFQGIIGLDGTPAVERQVCHTKIQDVLSPRYEIAHSDGNGLIRSSAMIRLLLDIPSLRQNMASNHSIVQIRYDGAKGTLVAWDDADFDDCLRNDAITHPSQYNVAIRDSMIKFDATFESLDVCRYVFNFSFLCFYGNFLFNSAFVLSRLAFDPAYQTI